MLLMPLVEVVAIAPSLDGSRCDYDTVSLEVDPKALMP